MRVFFLGVAVGMRDGEHDNRSMMVDPSRRTMSHGDYFRWARSARSLWTDILAGGEDEADNRDLIEDFRRAHTDLSGTLPGIPTFEDLIPRLSRAIRRTLVKEVNAARPDAAARLAADLLVHHRGR